MFITHLKALNFKNYEEVEARFSTSANALVGPNGSGKTNLLDAVHYLCLGKSYFNPLDRQLIRHDTDFLRVEAEFTGISGEEHSMSISLGEKRRKKIEWDDVALKKLSEHIGRIPVCVIAPDDTALIDGSSSERRKLLDYTISQLDREYLESLGEYNRILKQRNALLRSSQESGRLSPDLLAVYDEKMASPSTYIHEQRRKFVEGITGDFLNFYEKIAGKNEAMGLDYRSGMKDMDWQSLMKENFEKDRILGRTTSGLHRDDLIFSIDGHPLSRFGSQGQKKSYLVAMKIAQYDLLRSEKGEPPIFLLDDIFDKLDQGRISRLFELLEVEGLGQVFLTDTDEERAADLLKSAGFEFRTFKITNGTCLEQQ